MKRSETRKSRRHQQRAAFTQPSYWHFVAAAAGIVLGFRRRTVAGVSGLHHVGFSRFFSQAVWTMDALWKWWAAVVLLLVPKDEPIALAGDNTVARHTGGEDPRGGIVPRQPSCPYQGRGHLLGPQLGGAGALLVPHCGGARARSAGPGVCLRPT